MSNLAKYFVGYTKKSYKTLDDARARAYRIIDTMDVLVVQITDEYNQIVGYVEYSRPGYKPYWKKYGNARAYHVVEQSGAITKR